VFLVLGETVRPSDQGAHVVGVQRTNGAVHGDRAVRAGVDVGNGHRAVADRVHFARGDRVRVLFVDRRYKSGDHHGSVSSTSIRRDCRTPARYPATISSTVLFSSRCSCTRPSSR